MYAALIKEKLVLAVEEAILVRQKVKILNSDNYRCPQCRKKVILVLSESKAAFFKHLKKYDLQLGEKEEHHTSKLLLKSAFTAAGFDAQTEIPLAKGQLRADVLVSSKLAIEVQCAPLSHSEFFHRHQLYHQIGIFDLWVVGKRHFLYKKLNTTQLIFFRENLKWGVYYFEVLPKDQRLRLKYHVRQAPLTREIIYQVANFSLDELGIQQLWKFYKRENHIPVDIQKEKQYLWQQIHQKTKLGQKIASDLYQLGLSVDQLPDEIFAHWRKPGEIDCVSKFLKNKKANQKLD